MELARPLNIQLQDALLKRFWLIYLKGCLIISIIWSFALGVRLFIRQEHFDGELLLYSSLLSLSEITPYLTCLSAQLLVIRMAENKELQLMTLMGISTWSRVRLCSLAIATLCIATMLGHGFLKPYLKAKILTSPQDIIKTLAPMSIGSIRHLSDWHLLKSGEEQLLCSYQQQVLLLATTPQSSHSLGSGVLWPDLMKGEENIHFQSLELNSKTNGDSWIRQTLPHLLASDASDDNKKSALILRHALYPLWFFLFGTAMGHFTLSTSKNMGYTLCLGILLGLFFPINLLTGRTELFSSQATLAQLLISLPSLMLISVSLFVYRYSIKRGGLG